MLEHAGDYDREHWEPARSARRFECGSPNMLATMALEASLSLLEEVGMEKVEQGLSERVDHLQRELSAMPGVELLSPADPRRRAGILTFRIDGWDNQALFERLKSEQIVCAQRGGGIRLSPHFYTRTEITEQTLSIIHDLKAM